MMRIVLADDHHLVRQGIRALLQAEPDFAIVAEAADGVDALEQVELERPDVLITDLMMPRLGGLEVARTLAKAATSPRVLILSMHAEQGYVLQALRSGALGYVLKDSTADHLARAVREVAAGRRYLSPPLSLEAVESYLRKAAATPIDPYDTLTVREREVLDLAARGLSNQEISDHLFISRRTVEIHRANLLRKLDLRHQTDLVRFALRRGLLPLGE